MKDEIELLIKKYSELALENYKKRTKTQYTDFAQLYYTKFSVYSEILEDLKKVVNGR